MQGTLTLVGMMGAGKSAVGAELARTLGVPAVDSDHEIERAAAMTIPEIFTRDGEGFFREREAEVLARLLSGPPAVLSVGGGAWLRPGNREAIRGAGVVVWLDAPLEVLWQRVRMRSNRPLLATDDPRGTLETLLEARRPVYAEADIVVPVSAADSVEDTAAAVRRAVEAHRPGFLA
ncbi:shikimate kinase [Paracoccus sp. S-4012]|uniref:shikimate kinase n=1 Tax=Paracoccus sp. S-4012 TaxID=2665648 RepID=UPI0012B0D02D|nr:shikimate kinase [Paracoccus sp. S-4012]MRX50246.1 shikimate kinase [Paracoccus sp. S-4012]